VLALHLFVDDAQAAIIAALTLDKKVLLMGMR
jgi:hypothetical protein